MSERTRPWTPGPWTTTHWVTQPNNRTKPAVSAARLIANSPALVDALEDLRDTVKAAIYAGDWKVDGACDPDATLKRCDALLAEIYGEES